MHVLVPGLDWTYEGLPELPSAIQIHRTGPGPIMATIGWLARRRPLPPAESSSQGPQASATKLDSVVAGSGATAGSEPTALEPPRLNWKGRAVVRMQDWARQLLFPDVRGEWLWPARKALGSLLDTIQPDVVVSSHEPATTLEVGLAARRRGYPWVADLGDPVLAPYTPRRWRRRSRRVEAQVMARANHVTVTAQSAADLLAARHGRRSPVSLVTQGFDERLGERPSDPLPPAGPLELLYSGSFYSFRDPRSLVDAVLDTDGVRLSIAAGALPDWLVALAAEHPGRLRLLGRVPHRELLEIQRRVHVLVNLANADPCQVPGKFYEYLGAGRPILHLGGEGDVCAGLLSDLRRGWSCGAGRQSVSEALHDLVAAQGRGALDDGLDLGAGAVSAWSWTASARAMERVLLAAAAEQAKPSPSQVA